jgi:hypothetical protein
MPADYSGSGYYDFLRQMALGTAFWLKSFSSAEQVPENVTYPWEGLKNSEEEPMAKNKKGKSKNKGEKPKQKNAPAPKAVKQVIKHEKQEKKTLDNLVRNEKAMAKSLTNKVSAAPMMQRLESKLTRKMVNGRVVVEVILPLGPITMSTSNKYLDVLQTIKVNPQLFKDSTVFAEAKIHEKYKVTHTVVYESSCGSGNGGVVKTLFDPDPKDNIGAQLSQGQDLQNQWGSSFSAFQERQIRGKVVKSPLLWTNNSSDGLDSTRDFTDDRLTDAGTWVIYCRLPPTISGVIGEFCLVAEFTFYKTANEGMWSYGVGTSDGVVCNEGTSMPKPLNSGGDEMNSNLKNFFVGDQTDFSNDLGVNGFTINNDGYVTQAAGNWILTVMFRINSGSGGILPFITGFDNGVFMTQSETPTQTDQDYCWSILLNKRSRSTGSDFARVRFDIGTGGYNFDFWGAVVTPINAETYELLLARGSWNSEPSELVRGKNNVFHLPKPLSVKPTKTERLTSKPEKPSDVGSSAMAESGKALHTTFPNTGSMEDGVRSVDQFVGLTTVEIEDFLNKKRAIEQRQMAKVQEQIDSADVVRNLQKKIDRVNNQLKFAEMQPRLEFRQQVETHVKAKPEYPLAVAQANTQS